MSEDKELEYLKRRRLLEIQKRLLREKTRVLQQEKDEEQHAKTPEDVLNEIFVGRAWEVWQIAKQQYPQVTEQVAKTFTRLVETGKIREKVNGEQLYWLFTQLGVRLRFKTRIRILESGELKTIADKLHEQ